MSRSAQSLRWFPKQARLAALGPDEPEKDEILLAFGKNLWPDETIEFTAIAGHDEPRIRER